MIHAQINRDIRLSLADQILLIKAKKRSDLCATHRWYGLI